MKKYTKYSILFLLFVVISNVNPLQSLFKLFAEGILIEGPSEYYYSTKDKAFIHNGWLEAAENSPEFNRYKLTHPKSDWTLYRIDPIPFWKFWRWGEILTEEKWQQPYLEVSKDYAYKGFNEKFQKYPGFYGDSLRRLEVERYEDKDYKRSQGQEAEYK
jgi:hypothetical protein